VEIEYETFSNAESQKRIADKIANGSHWLCMLWYRFVIMSTKALYR